MPVTSPDDIAKASFALYDTLPAHGKPKPRSNGIPEWTILSTLHLYNPNPNSNSSNTGSHLIPISLGTGVKCLPANKLPPLGDVLHDCHAEILARRGYIRWLIEEAKLVAAGRAGLGVLEWVDEKFRLKEGVQVWMYVSALPCGDASTLHTAAYQPPEMAALKSKSQLHPPPGSPSQPRGLMRGRNGYTNFGAIRTKPGRTDSQISISMSCSDKIATWCALGLQGALLSGIFEPVYIDGVVVGGIEEDAPEGWAREGEVWGETIKREVERALYGRLACIEDHLSLPYHLHKPQVHLTSLPFIHSKAVISQNSLVEPVVSGVGILHIPGIQEAPKSREVITNGCPQGGSWRAPGLTLIPEKGRSQVCKYNILQAYTSLVDQLVENKMSTKMRLSGDKTYFCLKHPERSAYQAAKALIRGHTVEPALQRGFEVVGPLSVTSGRGGKEGEVRATPPFQGWLVSEERWEAFDTIG